jgi:hypothetical protein
MTILKHLFSPIQIGRMTAKNRLLMSAMSINFGVDENGYVTDQLTGYLGPGQRRRRHDPGGRRRRAPDGVGTSRPARPVGRRLHPGPEKDGCGGQAV